MIQFEHIAKFSNVEHGITEKKDNVPDNIVLGEQVHKDTIAWVEDGSKILIPKTDALATKKTGVTLGVKVADCVPLLFADTRSGIVGTIHAGWRGTALEITRKAIDFLRIKPFALRVGIGPAICERCFIVGEEVARQFDQSVVRESDMEEGKFHVDLWKANMMHAIDAGVPERNIEVIERCTVEDKQLYSFRAGDRIERNIAFIQKRVG